jgi:hypothetical protein
MLIMLSVVVRGTTRLRYRCHGDAVANQLSSNAACGVEVHVQPTFASELSTGCGTLPTSIHEESGIEHAADDADNLAWRMPTL